MTKTRTTSFDIAEHLRTPDDMAAYLDAMFDESGEEPRSIVRAIGDVARAKGMTQLARRTGLGRESLYKALSGESSPSFDTILRVVRALDLRLSTVVMAPARRLRPVRRRAVGTR